jgi:hypothetical protein
MRKILKFSLCALALELAVVTSGAQVKATAVQTSEEALSFDMWCLEMQYYPPIRCDVRQKDDVVAYDKYRKDVEQYNDQRAARDEKDRQLLKKLNSNSSDTTRDHTDGMPN